MHGFLKTNTYRTLTVALVAPLVFTAALRGEPGGDECPVEKRVTELIGSWKAAGDEAKALTPAERTRLETRVAALAGECPIGSRLGATLSAARDVLGAVIASSEECAKDCPLEKAGAQAAEVKKLKELRGKALRHLHSLASYGAAAAPASACCAESSAGGIASAEKSASCSTTCAIELAVRVGSLQASWKAAAREVASISPETRQKKLAAINQLAERSKCVALLPPTLIALADGFDALDGVHARMKEWAESNPAVFESLPAEARKAFARQAALVRETGRVLASARSALKEALSSCDEDSPAVEAARKS